MRTSRAAPIFLLGIALSLPGVVGAYPSPSSPYRWPGNSDTFNIHPTNFPKNSTRWQQVLDAISSWSSYAVPAASFYPYYWDPGVPVDPGDHGDTLSTVGFVGTISDTLIVAATVSCQPEWDKIKA